jgi:hypothetical protein
MTVRKIDMAPAGPDDDPPPRRPFLGLEFVMAMAITAIAGLAVFYF